MTRKLTDPEVATSFYDDTVTLSDGSEIHVQRSWTGVPPDDVVWTGMSTVLPTGEWISITATRNIDLGPMLAAMYEAASERGK